MNDIITTENDLIENNMPSKEVDAEMSSSETAHDETSGKPKDEPAESMEDYKDELEASLRKVREGDTMNGEVIAFNEHGVILDLHYYATGRIPVEDMSSDPSFNIMTDVNIGDQITAIVRSTDDGHGNILLSKTAAESEYSWDKLKELMENDAVITGTISDAVPKGAVMYVEGIRGFIPASRLDVKYVEDTSLYKGRQMQVKITEIDEEREKLILSAKELLKEAFLAEKEENIGLLEVGSIVKGKVESLQSYGAFVDIGNGISGLLHVSQITDKRISHPKAVLHAGQEVTVMITRIEGGKVSLSIKAAEEADAQKTEEEAQDYHSEYVPNNPFADLLKDYLK